MILTVALMQRYRKPHSRTPAHINAGLSDPELQPAAVDSDPVAPAVSLHEQSSPVSVPSSLLAAILTALLWGLLPTVGVKR